MIARALRSTQLPCRRASSALVSRGHEPIYYSSGNVPTPVSQTSSVKRERSAQRELVSNMFSYLKQSAEVRHYLKHFGNTDSDRFAVIKVTGDLLHLPGEAERVASALVFLHRVGLVPVVVHGAGLFSGKRADEVEEALRDAIESESSPTSDNPLVASIATAESQSKSGLEAGGSARLHNAAARLALQEAEAYMHRANTALCNAIEALGVRAAPMLSGCFDAELDTDATGPEQGIIGRIKGVNTAAIHEAVAEGAVPVVAALATITPHGSNESDYAHSADDETETDSTLTFSTWAASAALAKDLKPLKIVILRPDGGFLNADGSRLSRISLARDLDQLCPKPHPLVTTNTSSSMEEAAASMAEYFGSNDTESNDDATNCMLHRPTHQDLLRSPVLDHPHDSQYGSDDAIEPALPEMLAFPSTMENLVAVDTTTAVTHAVLHAGHDAHALPSADQDILRQVHDLFNTCDLEPGSTIAITSPEHLASELFTERGRGTLVVRGEQVVAYDSLDDLDQVALGELLEEAFGKKLPAEYFDSIRHKLLKVYASATLRGAAIVTMEDGFPYLDKFAVSPSAQGDKLGDDVWQALVSGQPQILWRSRSDNRVNSWYFERSHGSYMSHSGPLGRYPQRDACAAESSGHWTVFWRGVADDRIIDAVTTALKIPKTFQ